MLQLLLPKSAENSSLRHDLSDRQDRPSPQAMRLQVMYERLIALKRMLGEACVVQSEVWEVMGDLTRVAFGTPMFSRRLDAGYLRGPISYSGYPIIAVLRVTSSNNCDGLSFAPLCPQSEVEVSISNEQT
jgi:hypothetical protein